MRYDILTAGVLLLACGKLTSAAVVLIENGNARTAIYAPARVMQENQKIKGLPQSAVTQETARQRLRDSVKDLAAYLEKMSGAHVDVFAREPLPEDNRTPIFVGACAEKVFGPCAQNSPFRQGWRLVISGKGVGFLGESDEAVSYGIYELLDRLGCRWFLPGDLGEDIPQMKTIRLEESDLSAVPSLMCRCFGITDAAFKRRIRAGGVAVQFNNLGGEAIEGRVKKPLAAHPDWNAEIGGKRAVTGWLCLSNPEVSAAVADAITAKLDADPAPTVILSEGYVPKFCECARCKALDAGGPDSVMGSPHRTDRYVHFCNQVARRVTQKYPKVLFGMMASIECMQPPLREKLHPNLLPIVVPIICCRAHSLGDPGCPSRQEARSAVEGWAKLTDRLGFYEFFYNLGELTAPYPMLRLKEDLPFLLAHHVQMWMPYGWVPDVLPTYEASLPGLYLSARMAWDPKARPEQVLDELYSRFYGAAAEPMRRYWQVMDDAWQKTPEHAGQQYGYDRRFTPAVMASARAAINEAIGTARNDRERARIQLADDSLRRFELFMKLRRELCAGQLAGLDAGADNWLSLSKDLTKRYAANSAFSGYTGPLDPAYKEGGRIAREFTLMQPPLRQWRYRVDREKKGADLGWSKSDFDDHDWPTTDPCVETWADLDLYGYFGAVWYRAGVRLPSIPAGKRTYLWVSGTDGGCRLFVNGVMAPFVNAKGEREAEANGFRSPFSFDITGAARPDAENQITLVCNRAGLIELGTGGLLGPVMLYHEKP